ncbi:MAG: hydrolase [Aquiluna sp.]|nr:hydrolase [Aquiluna sp.]MCF8545245.1 hydrolase [Aquiluna sp.]
MKLTIAPQLDSPARKRPAERAPIRVGCVQVSWRNDPLEHKANLENAIRIAADNGAEIVFLPELTLSRYPADVCPTGVPSETAEPLLGGPTQSFVAELAKELGIYIHASLYEDTGFEDGRGLNTAIVVNPDGKLHGKTPKLHIPVTEGYFEDKYFQEGPSKEPYKTVDLPLAGEPVLGMPTCWDEWFPEVARSYALQGADILCYPTAIGSEPDHPDFDTEPLWRQTIVGHAIANGLFIVVPNRWGNEGLVSFYGSSFIVDPYGRVIARAQREGDEVLIADLDLDQRRDWLELFPFFGTRRPDTYGLITNPRINPRTESGLGENGGIPGLQK